MHVATFLAIPLIAVPLLAQTAPVYLMVRCIKALPGKGGDYQQTIMDTTRKAMQIRVDEGAVSSWVFARSVIPGGEASECDFMLVNVHDGFPPERVPIDPYFEKAGVTISRSEWYARMGSQSKLMKLEMWQSIDETGAIEKGNYFRLNYVKTPPARIDEWARMQSEIWKPVHNARVRDGELKGWQASRLFLPSGTIRSYNARTLSIFPNWQSVPLPSRYAELLPKLHPGKNPQEILDRIAQLQEIVSAELFEVLEVVRPSRKR